MPIDTAHSLRSTRSRVLRRAGRRARNALLTLGVLASLLGANPASAADCAPGSFSATGQEPCTLAPPGSFVDRFGATQATLAPPGSFVADFGATQTTLAPPGFFVPVEGATEATPAPVGHFVPVEGATAPTPAPRGTFVADEGASAPTAAPAGRYQDEEGQAFAKDAPAGYFVQDTGSALPSPAQGGTFTAFDGQVGARACLPGEASRAGASICSAVAPGVGTDLDPEFDTNFGTGISPTDTGEITFGSVSFDANTFLTDELSLSIELRNDAMDHGLTGALSSSLTLLDVFFVGGESGLFSIDGFQAGDVIEAGGSRTYELTLASFDVRNVSLDAFGFFDTELIFRTDQGNAFGFDPHDGLFDPIAVEEGYEAFRASGYDLASNTLPLSREFGFRLAADVPAPGPVGLMVLALLAIGRRAAQLRRR